MLSEAETAGRKDRGRENEQGTIDALALVIYDDS